MPPRGRHGGDDSDAVLPVRAAHTASPAAVLVGLPLAAASGVLLALLLAVAVDGEPPAASVAALRALVGGAASLALVVPRARRVLTVVVRALLLGTVEWTAMALAAPTAAARASSMLTAATTASQPLPRDVAWCERVEWLTGPFALVMTAACLAALLVALRLERKAAAR